MAALYRRNPEIADRIIDGEVFVVTPGDSTLHTLNEAATLIWDLAEAGCTAEEAARALVERYEVSFSVALRDVTRCLDDLVARGILEIE